MKKILMLVLIVLSVISYTYARDTEPCKEGKFSLTVGAGMRTFSESMYKDVYDTGGVMYSVDLAYKVIPVLEVFVHSDYFTKDGSLTYTKEATTLDIIPVELGLRYLVNVSDNCRLRLYPYVGAGAGIYMIKEENVIGTFEKNQVGFFAEGGVRFYATGSLFIDGKLKYVLISVKPEEGDNVKLGGLGLIGGIGLSF